MNLYLAALLLGVISGLRTMTAPAAVTWAATLGVLNFMGTPLAFLHAAAAPLIATLLAVGELVADKLPTTPSRKVPVQFGARIVMGALSGGAVGLASGAPLPGAVLGVAGAVLGTYGGAAGRAALARAFGRDLPAALIEDGVAIAGAILVVGLIL